MSFGENKEYKSKREVEYTKYGHNIKPIKECFGLAYIGLCLLSTVMKKLSNEHTDLRIIHSNNNEIGISSAQYTDGLLGKESNSSLI